MGQVYYYNRDRLDGQPKASGTFIGIIYCGNGQNAYIHFTTVISSKKGYF